MSNNVSACAFIKNTFTGAFCIFESMASILPFVDEMIVMDLGSADGTKEYLQEIADANPKVVLEHGNFYKIDANVFATLANDLIAMCKYDNVLYWQADEIWHEKLLVLMEDEFENGNFDLAFWRIQYRENFQKVKWFPHVVHRVGHKNKFNFVGDGMNTDRHMEPHLVGHYDGGWFIRWGDEFKDRPEYLPTQEMIMDVSLVGGFLENIAERRGLHAPFWNETADIEGQPARQWYEREQQNPNWKKTESPFDIPHIMKFHIGRQKYELRQSLLHALKTDTTRELLNV